MADRVVVCVGTKRGLFLFESSRSRRAWKRRGPFLEGWQVYHAVIDARRAPRVHAAASNPVFATTTLAGSLPGASFRGAERPPIPPRLLSRQAKAAGKWGIPTAPRVWHIEPGRPTEKGVLYAGTAPAGLFRSEDDGRTWGPVEGLLRHPSRRHWQSGFGGMCLHSIQLDPRDPGRIYVAISAAGAFRSDDGGRRWTPINRAVARYAGAPKDGQVGTCVHKLLLHPAVPGRLYQQNHMGVYRSDDAGGTWRPIHSKAQDYGFPLALHPRDPDTCFVAPLEAKEYGFRATTGALRVHRWSGRGRGWRALGRGLPGDGAYLSVLREGMACDPLDPCGLYLGTGTGQLFHSADEGQSWRAMALFLPPILSVSAAVV